MRRVISILVIIIGVLAALVTIATGIVFFKPEWNPFSSPPNIAGEWDGSLTIKTNNGPTGDIHLSFSEKSDGALSGTFSVKPPLDAGNDGPITVGSVTKDGHIGFTVTSSAPHVILVFSGIYDAANNRLSGTYDSRFGGYSGVWDANETKADSLEPVAGPHLLSDEGLTFIALQVCRGGTALLLIILGLIWAKNPKVRVAHAARQ
jgi:hypothetical protein